MNGSTTRGCWEKRGAPERWWGSASLSLQDPKGKASPESGGLSRTVEKFSHNQTQTELRGAVKRPLSTERERGRERTES